MKILTLLIGVSIGTIITGFTIAFIISKYPLVQPRDYQIEIKGAKALIYDGNKFKGLFLLQGQIDSLITKDNQ